MASPDSEFNLERQIADWRNFLLSKNAVSTNDADELEDHLRGSISDLVDRGLSTEEAFLVSAKRVGELNLVSREFALEYTERAWKQLVSPSASTQQSSIFSGEFVIVLALAICAALAIKLPQFFGLEFSESNAGFYARNLGLFVFPFLAGYFFWKRQLTSDYYWKLGIPFLLALLFANIYPYSPDGATEVLSILHLPIALWLVVGLAYVGNRWNNNSGRMDFVRYTGELFIYYALIALGGGALTGLTFSIFNAIGLNIEMVVATWVIPCGAMGAVLIGSWLVEAKQNVIENMAPVLTRVFTPLFTLMLLVFLMAMLWTGQGIDVSRDVLIGFDLLLAVVLGLLLYSISARDLLAPPTYFDRLTLVLVLSALLVDLFALTAILGRVSEFGFSPNKVAALGENIILLVNLGWSAMLYWRFINQRDSFAALVHWQMRYLPVYSLWAALVVTLFPPLFGFV